MLTDRGGNKPCVATCPVSAEVLSDFHDLCHSSLPHRGRGGHITLIDVTSTCVCLSVSRHATCAVQWRPSSLFFLSVHFERVLKHRMHRSSTRVPLLLDSLTVTWHKGCMSSLWILVLPTLRQCWQLSAELVLSQCLLSMPKFVALVQRCLFFFDTSAMTGQQEVAEAKLLVLPGVGTFGSTLDLLKEKGLIEILKARMNAGRPTLCVCVGLQILMETSTEV
jgi:hypothetical protein